MPKVKKNPENTKGRQSSQLSQNLSQEVDLRAKEEEARKVMLDHLKAIGLENVLTETINDEVIPDDTLVSGCMTEISQRGVMDRNFEANQTGVYMNMSDNYDDLVQAVAGVIPADNDMKLPGSYVNYDPRSNQVKVDVDREKNSRSNRLLEKYRQGKQGKTFHNIVDRPLQVDDKDLLIQDLNRRLATLEYKVMTTQQGNMARIERLEKMIDRMTLALVGSDEEIDDSDTSSEDDY